MTTHILLLHNTYPHLYVYIHACKRVNNVFSVVCVRICVFVYGRARGGEQQRGPQHARMPTACEYDYRCHAS
jgi:hypothetical protein